jgi:AraC family transcriptional regulator, transcriptional activator of pobA
MKKQTVPSYFVYGEPARELDVGFVHVELVSARQNLHHGKVIAHQHAHMGQITFWFKGKGTYFIDDKTWTFLAPAISFVPSSLVHGFSVSPQSDAIVISIANDAVQKINLADSAKINSLFFTQKELSKSDWTHIQSLMTLANAEYASQRTNSISILEQTIAIILTLLVREAKGTVFNTEQKLPLSKNLSQLIDIHFREQWSVEDYCAALNSTYHMVDKAAHAGFGFSIKTMIVRRRVLEAKRLLKFTIRSVEDIAFELGFKDAAYFNRLFKRHAGKSPGAWRQG